MGQASRRELIRDLKERLRSMERSCRPTRSPIGSTGIDVLDRLLPAKGLERGALIEWLSEGEGAGAATLALTVAGHVLQGNGAVVVIDGKREFYPPAAARLGIPLEQTVIVQPRNAADARWALEQALRCRAVAVALGWIEELNDRTFRRLQLAAEAGGNLGFLLRPAACRAAPSWAEVRFLVRALPPGAHATRLAFPISCNEPLVLYASGGGKLLVTACSSTTDRCGVVPGMSLAEARALMVITPGSAARCEPHDPRSDRIALQKLAGWCQRFSPLVAVEEAESPDSLFLDITGCGPLFGGEAALAAKVVAEFRRRGYWARAAVADTVGAAWGVVRYGAKPAKDRSASFDPVLVPPDGQAEALRPLPVEALRLSGNVVQVLCEFDIRRVGQLLALPRADLPSRFGPEVGRRLDQALGYVPELLTFESAAEPVEASWEFDPPAADRRLIDAVLERLLEEVLERLRPRQLGVQQLLCSLRTTAGKKGDCPSSSKGQSPFFPAGEPIHVRVGLLQASDSYRHLLELLRLHFERVRILAEVSAIVVRAAVIVPLEFHQGQIFEAESGADRWRQFPVLIERLSHRLGEKAVLRPRLWPDAQPELACRLEPWLRQDRQDVQQPAYAGRSPEKPALPLRPTCLKSRPVPLAVVSVVPGGPPLRFWWKGQSHGVARYRGPERIETGWWRGQDVRRDYYLVETTAGNRFWLFRARGNEAWFLHGIFT